MANDTGSGFTVNTLQKEQETRRDSMSVILKQRTCRTADGRAVPDGDPDSAFLIGPIGGKISDETAIAIGLVDGWLPDSKEAKEIKKQENKEHKAPRADKSGRRKAKDGEPLPAKPTKVEKLVGIIDGMIREFTEAGNAGGQVAADAIAEKLFTKEHLPDSRVLAARLEDNVSADERDEAWLEFQIANPDINFGDDTETKGDEGSNASKSPEGSDSKSPEKDTGTGGGGPDDII